MKTTKETIEILKCNPCLISRFINDGRLILEADQSTDKRKKFFTDESVENLRISRSKEIVKKIAKVEIEIKKEKKRKKLQKENSESFELNDLGKQIMLDTVAELKSLGLHRENDKYAILDYAMFYQLAMASTLEASKNITYWDMKGIQRISADTTVSISLQRMLDDKRKRLGLDPHARAKLTIKEKEDLDEMSEIMNG